MNWKSLQGRSLIATGMFVLVTVANLAIAYRYDIPITTKYIFLQFLVAIYFLGWLGLGELRRLGKPRLLRSIQITVVLIAVPLLAGLVNGHGEALSVLGGVVMCYAFGAAMWYRRTGSRVSD